MVHLTEYELIEQNDLNGYEKGDRLYPEELSWVDIAFQCLSVGLVNKNSLDFIYGFYKQETQPHENKTLALRFYPSDYFFRSLDVNEFPIYFIRLRRLFYK